MPTERTKDAVFVALLIDAVFAMYDLPGKPVDVSSLEELFSLMDQAGLLSPAPDGS